MRKITLFAISSLLSLGLITACSTNKEVKKVSNTEQTNIATKEQTTTTRTEQDIKEIAYNQLTSRDKERIAGKWQNSRLTKTTLTDSMGNIVDKSYIGKEVHLIDFPTEASSKPNNMIVYLSIDNNKLLGYGFVD